jgi:hypothetical protein
MQPQPQDRREEGEENNYSISIKQHNKELDALYQRFSNGNKSFESSRSHGTSKVNEVLAPILGSNINLDKHQANALGREKMKISI